MILASLSDPPVVVDFEGLQISSVSFFDESFGQLALQFGETVLNQKIRVERIDKFDQALLLDIVKSRSREAQIRPGPFSNSLPTTVISDNELEQRLEGAIKSAGVTMPLFSLTATPTSFLQIRGLFKEQSSSVVQALNAPPRLRENGFDLGARQQSRVVNNQLRRVILPSWRTLDLWRDGVVIYVDCCQALTWGNQQFPEFGVLINPLALCEQVYLFAELSRLVYQNAVPPSQGVTYGISLKGLEKNGKPAGLREHLNLWADAHRAPSSDFISRVNWNNPKIDAGAIAFQLVAEVFRWFGYFDEQIAYSREREDGETVIDPELIKTAGNN
jgi:hypothetical protein